MTPGKGEIDEYRSAFYQTFAEDHGLTTEWQFPPQIPLDLPDIKAGTILIGFQSGVGLPN